MSQDTQPGDLSRSVRIIDLKLPLPWLLSTAAAVCLSIAGMYFKLDQLGQDVTELKTTVKAGNGQTATLQGEIAILRFRVENLETDKKAASGGHGR